MGAPFSVGRSGGGGELFAGQPQIDVIECRAPCADRSGGQPRSGDGGHCFAGGRLVQWDGERGTDHECVRGGDADRAERQLDLAVDA
jgi:hypothetical protein